MLKRKVCNELESWLFLAGPLTGSDSVLFHQSDQISLGQIIRRTRQPLGELDFFDGLKQKPQTCQPNVNLF